MTGGSPRPNMIETDHEPFSLQLLDLVPNLKYLLCDVKLHLQCHTLFYQYHQYLLFFIMILPGHNSQSKGLPVNWQSQEYLALFPDSSWSLIYMFLVIQNSFKKKQNKTHFSC